MRRRSTSAASPLLVVGLRNPGDQYRGTRHNVGAEVVVAAAVGTEFRRAPRKIMADVSEFSLGGVPAVAALPLTFMNESGGPVVALLKWYKTDPTGLILVHDDIDLPFGRLRFHHGRGSGGHNGVASVMRAIGSRDVWRLKIGVGRPPGRQDPADFVLRRFTERERDDVDLMVSAGAEVLHRFGEAGGEEARQAAGDASARLGIAKGDNP